MASVNGKIALAIFGVLVIGAPLLFGAVDREIQIGLTAVLGLGLIFVKPVFPKFDRAGFAILTAVMLVFFSQFLPHFFFGQTHWRNVLTASYGLTFPFTHHPEPARAADAMLTMIVGALWFFWVRTLADERSQRLLIAWMLFGSAAALAVVSLAIGSSTSDSIYGLRPTPGWTGFGPFPNRNHTACFLAMGTIIGIGCLANAVRHKRFVQLAFGNLFLLPIVIAVFASKSRGAVAALAVGLCVYSILALIRSRTQKVLAVILAGAFVGSALLLAFGSKVMARFVSESDGGVSTQTRLAVWRDALTMWKDAPIFGHGLDTFAGLFPIYQTLRLDNQIVLHPESSWLQWLVEWGALPVAIAVIVLILFLAKNLAEMLAKKNGFFVRASGFAAVAVLLSHSLWDVPAHRWATAAFGLAALALVPPFRSREPLASLNRRVAFVPFAIALFWLVPFAVGIPTCWPTSLDRLMARDAKMPANVELPQLAQTLRYFPLDPELHEAVGLREMFLPNLAPSAWEHFRIADRLEPSSWSLPATQAQASRRISPGMSLHFWSVALERAGWRSDELFQTAYRDTSDLPVAESFWGHYVENNPHLLLVYAQVIPDADARFYFSLWWKNRAFAATLTSAEIDIFNRCESRWGTRANLDEWMKHYADREERDFKSWASLLHDWKDDVAAWQLLSRHIQESETPPPRVTMPTQALENQWAINPGDLLNAQDFAAACLREDKKEKGEKVIIAVAETDHAPRWFLRKAAYIYASNGDYAKAVEALLRGG